MYIALDDKNNLTLINHAVTGWDYFCPACGAKMAINRGEIRRSFFSHYPGLACSDTWENRYDLSDWHREWQEYFPLCNREVILKLGTIVHRADILTGKTVIEFQHSPLSSEEFNKRNAFYTDLGYKVVWLFDLIEEHANGKIALIDKDDEKLTFSWSHPRNTFCRYDLEAGQIEIFLQLSSDGKNQIVKLKRNTEENYSEFDTYPWCSKSDFLSYFECTDGKCPEPFRNDLKINADYLEFTEKYSICLDSQQERAVENIEGATLVLAVPGSGKTTTMISRIGYMVKCRNIKGNRILALTYTKSAAEDMRQRYVSTFGNNDDVEFRTINSFAYGVIQEFNSRKKTIAESDKKKLIRDIYKQIKPSEFPTESDIKEAALHITNIKNMMLTEEDIKQRTIWNICAWDVYQRYSVQLAESSAIDYDDQLVLAEKILRNHPNILKKIQDRYDFICVDEAQDTSRIQYEIIKMLAAKNNNIFMVGDEDQSIYRFRGAYPEGLLHFKEDYPNPFILYLETNYRSTEEIVKMSSGFIAKNKSRYPKKMNSFRGSGEHPGQIYVSNRTEQYRKMLELIRFVKKDTAILYRDNASMIPLADLFFKNAIPFTIKNPKEIIFFDNRVVTDCRAFLKLIHNDRDIASFERINKPLGLYLKRTFLNGICGKVRNEGKTFSDALHEWFCYHDKYKPIFYDGIVIPARSMKPSLAIRHFYEKTYREYLLKEGISVEPIEILISLATDDTTIEEFLEHLDRLESQLKSHKNNVSNIILSTIHSSKGLEYDEVYILDVFDDILPSVTNYHESDELTEQYEEERRLLYVAMTRAKNKLHFFELENRTSMFQQELFPPNGMSLDSILSSLTDDTIFVRNKKTNRFYALVLTPGRTYRANEIDLETGEIVKENAYSVIEDKRYSKIWEIIQQL